MNCHYCRKGPLPPGEPARNAPAILMARCDYCHRSQVVAFGGETYEPERDYGRLSAELGRVRAVMADGEWHTLAEVSALAHAPEASVSARIRDLRKPLHGGHRVEREYVERGLWRYRLAPNEKPPGGATSRAASLGVSG